MDATRNRLSTLISKRKNAATTTLRVKSPQTKAGKISDLTQRAWLAPEENYN